MNRLLKALVPTLLSLLLAAPAAAYTIYLKDGSKIEAREAYEVIDGTAYFTYINGTRTFLDAGEIDVERTRTANEQNLGTALVLEGGRVREMKKDEVQQQVDRKTLADLIASRSSTNLDRNQGDAPGTDLATGLPLTRSGHTDLRAAPQRPYGDVERASAIVGLFQSQGLEDVEILEGTGRRSLLARVVTSSEPQVFRAIAVAAAALRQATEDSDLESFQLVLVTPTGERAGQFEITPEMADDLVSRRVDLPLFFQAHVQF
ncbi:MAG: hypothetical protein AAF604_04185 [Acidobacteriota bacterium]